MFNIHASEYLTIQLQPAALIHHGKRPLWGKVCVCVRACKLRTVNVQPALPVEG